MRGQLAGHIDVAQVAIYIFWGFFAGLVLYLRREDKREGYPMVADVIGPMEQTNRLGLPEPPPPKMFRHYHGGVSFAPQTTTIEPPIFARPAANFAGAPIDPVGNPLLAGIGPGAWAMREEKPDLTWTGEIKVKPLRLAHGFSLHHNDANPIGWPVVGADRLVAGTVIDVWVDEVEEAVQFLEVRLTTDRIALVPMPFVKLSKRRQEARVRAITAAQFLDIPAHANPDFVTRREEDRLVGYFGAGLLYAYPSRLGPTL